MKMRWQIVDAEMAGFDKETKGVSEIVAVATC